MLFARSENRTTTYGRLNEHLKAHPRILRIRCLGGISWSEITRVARMWNLREIISFEQFCLNDFVDFVAGANVIDHRLNLII